MRDIGTVHSNLSGVNTPDFYLNKFKSAGSEALNADGTTPKEFILEDLTAGQKILIEKITLTISGDGVLVMTEFGSIAALVNGLLISFGNSTINIKDNIDLTLVSTNKNIHTIFTALGAADTTVLNVTIDLSEALGGNGIMTSKEDLKITVRDNLSALAYLRASCSGILLQEN